MSVNGSSLDARTVHTLNSVYQIDMDAHTIRRLDGVNPPTPNQGEDGSWYPYESCTLVNGSLFIRWDDAGKATFTSRVVSDTMPWPQGEVPNKDLASESLSGPPVGDQVAPRAHYAA